MPVTTNPAATGVPVSPNIINPGVTVNPLTSGIAPVRADVSRTGLFVDVDVSGASPIQSIRDALTQLLSDGATVADYDASLGITGTLNASAWANQIGAAPSLAQATGGNQPIVLPFTGAKYAYLPGVSANALSTPSATANKITGDIDLRWVGSLNDWTPTANNTFISKDNAAGSGRSYNFVSDSGGTGKIALTYSNDGTSIVGRAAISSSAVAFADGAVGGVRATYTVATGKVNFYTSDDNGATWTLLGVEQTITSGAIFDSTTSVYVGQLANGAIPAVGRCLRAQIYNGIGGTLAVDFNAADWPETSTNGATQASSTTGETWTLNNTGAKPAQIVASASLLADGTAHKMATANFTLDQPFTEYFVAKQITWTAGDYLSSGTAGVAGITSVTATPNIGLNAGAAAAENAGATLGAYHVLTAVFDGASSSLAVDSAAAATGDAGAGNPGGLSLFSDNAGANYGNWQVKRRIVRSGSDSAATQAQIQALLKAIHGTP